MTGSGGRTAFAHDAVIGLAPGGDERAPGGAVTGALCGSWAHEPPCPLAPHHTGATRSGDEVRLRVLFAARPADEQLVRDLVRRALAVGAATGPDGRVTTWRLLGDAPSAVRDDEQEHADRLAAG